MEADGHPLSDLYPLADRWSRPSLGAAYVSSASRGRWAQALLALAVVIQLFSILARVLEQSILGRGVGNITLAQVQASDSRIHAAVVAQGLIVLLTAIFFLRWLHRAYANLPQVGVRGMRFTPGWAVGYWFIPILSLWRPKQIVDDLWRATAPDAHAMSDGGWRRLRTTQLTIVWWSTWLAGNALELIGRRMSVSSLDALKSRNSLFTVSDVLTLAAAVCLLMLVRSISARQETQATTLHNLSQS